MVSLVGWAMRPDRLAIPWLWPDLVPLRARSVPAVALSCAWKQM
ncbi:MAG: hypothetical protein ACSHWZ_06615 [Sulfitobacter sp.]